MISFRYFRIGSKNNFFIYKNSFLAEKSIFLTFLLHFFLTLLRIYSDKSELDLSDETIIIKKIHFSGKLWWKWSKRLRSQKMHSFQTIKDTDPKFWKPKLKTWMKVVWKFHANNLYAFREICRQRPLRSVQVGSGQFIVLNNSASPKMVMKMYFNFFRFF